MSVMIPPITVDLVKTIVQEHSPAYSGLPVEPVATQGWDNRTFRLGSTHSVRLPSAKQYEAQTLKEWEWLPFLARRLPLSIPVPVELGKPNEHFPLHWSIRPWIEGAPVTEDAVSDLSRLARELGRFLVALRSVSAKGGPAPGAHNFLRGASPSVYDEQTRSALEALSSRIDTRVAAQIWDDAIRANASIEAVWLHGDIAPTNLLVQSGRLTAVLDFGCAAVGDPACDLAIAWTFFRGPSRRAFRDAVDVDAGTWKRARGWALWKALILEAGIVQTNAVTPERNTANLREILAVPVV